MGTRRSGGHPDDLASALEAWAASRERAVGELMLEAANLVHQGSTMEAAYLRFAARHLEISAMHERAQAAALRETTTGLTPSCAA
jgi:hypothetical protein